MKNSLLCAFAALLLGTACGQSGVGGACTTCPNPTIAIGLSTSSLTVAQGGNGSLTATITRGGGFTGAVTIVTTGAPAGVTGIASNITTTGSVISGTVTVTVAGSVAAGIYNLTVQASGPGVTSVTQGFTLTVTAPAIGVALSIGAQSIDQGATGAAVTVTITRTNFPGALTLTVEGAPAGVTAVLNPPNPTGNTSFLTLQVGAAVPAGTYTLTLRAAGTGVTDATASLALTVTVPADFTVALAPSALSVSPGTSFGATVNITRIGVGIGPVAMTATNVPAGVTVSFIPSSVSGASGTVSFAVAPGTAGGLYPIGITGTAGGISRSTTMQLTVPQTTPTTNLLTATPTAAVVEPGSTQAIVIGVPGASPIDPATIAVSGVPAGMDFAGCTPAIVIAESCVLLFRARSAPPMAVPGFYTITVDATGASGTKQVTVELIVVIMNGFAMAGPNLLTLPAAGTTPTSGFVNWESVFQGTVTFSATSTAPGMSVAFQPTAVGSNGTGSPTAFSASVTTTAATPPGWHLLTLQGSGSNRVRGSAVLTTTNGSFDQPAQLQLGARLPLVVQRGGSGTGLLLAARPPGFVTPLTILVPTGAPAGVTITFPPAGLNVWTEFTISASAAVAQGTYLITFSVLGNPGTGVVSTSTQATVTIL